MNTITKPVYKKGMHIQGFHSVMELWASKFKKPSIVAIVKYVDGTEYKEVFKRKEKYVDYMCDGEQYHVTIDHGLLFDFTEYSNNEDTDYLTIGKLRTAFNNWLTRHGMGKYIVEIVWQFED